MTESSHPELSGSLDTDVRDVSGKASAEGVADEWANDSGAVVIPFPRPLQNVEPSQTVEFLKAAQAQLRASQAVFASVDPQFLVDAMVKMGCDPDYILGELKFLNDFIQSVGTIAKSEDPIYF